MTDALVRDHVRDVEHQFARCRGRSPRPGQVQGETRQPDARHPWPRLRSRVGYRLVEAGLYLLADGPQARG